MVDPVADLESLARWSPDLEGSALPLEAPAAGDPDRVGRARLDPATMHVRASSLQSSSRGSRPDGRPARMDYHHRDLLRALAALRRLDAMVQTTEGAWHAVVLLYAYWWCGPTARARWDGAGDGPIAVKTRALGFAWRVGRLFATDAQLRAWAGFRPSAVRVASADYGTRLIADASRAYSATNPDGCPRGGRVSLPAVRRLLDALAARCDADAAGKAEQRRKRDAGRKGPPPGVVADAPTLRNRANDPASAAVGPPCM